MRISSLRIVLLAMLLSGCRAAQLAKDHEAFRNELTHMYTDQVMGNLILCQKGLPFVQLDYSKITGTISQDSTASFEDGQTAATARALSGAGVLTGVTRTITTALKGTLGFKQNNQLSFIADPVVNQPAIYRAYLDFLNVDGSLVRTCNPPPPCAAVAMKRCGNCYYWVPDEFRADFRELCLKAVAMRGEPLEIPRFFETHVTGLITKEPVGTPESTPEGKLQQWEATVGLSPSLPADSGTFEAVIKGRQYHFSFEIPRGMSEADVEKPEAQMDRIVIQYVQDSRPADQIPEEEIKEGHVPLAPTQLAEELGKQTLKIRLSVHLPAVPTTHDLIRSIDNELELIRLNQLRTP